MTGPTFEFIPHTADIGVRLRAPSLAALFEIAATAFTDAVTTASTVRAAISREIALEAADVDLLLVDWLEELLYLFETQSLLVADAVADVSIGPPAVLRATVHGEARDPSRHPLKLLIKAVTYHGLEVERTSGGYAATVIFDI